LATIFSPITQGPRLHCLETILSGGQGHIRLYTYMTAEAVINNGPHKNHVCHTLHTAVHLFVFYEIFPLYHLTQALPHVFCNNAPTVLRNGTNDK